MLYNAKESGGIFLFCQKCGRELAGGDKFCTACGAPVSGERPSETAEGTESFSAETQTESTGSTERTAQADSVWDTDRTAGQASARFMMEEKPHYQKNTGILVGVIGGIGALVILLLFVSVMVTGGRVKSNMSDVFPDQREEKQDDWDFDADEDFDFGFGDDFSEDDFGDYF